MTIIIKSMEWPNKSMLWPHDITYVSAEACLRHHIAIFANQLQTDEKKRWFSKNTPLNIYVIINKKYFRWIYENKRNCFENNFNSVPTSWIMCMYIYYSRKSKKLFWKKIILEVASIAPRNTFFLSNIIYLILSARMEELPWAMFAKGPAWTNTGVPS